jgi:UPF0755 protein
VTDRGAPRHGRHSSPDEGWGAESPSWGAGSSFWAQEAPDREAEAWRSGGGGPRDPGPSTVERFAAPRGRGEVPEWAAGGGRRSSGVIDRWPDETGPMPQWRHHTGGGDDGGDGPAPRPDDVPPRAARDLGPGGRGGDPRHPSGPLPPMPRSAWSKLRPRHHDDEHDDAYDDGYDDGYDADDTAAAPSLHAPPAGRAPSRRVDDADTEAHRLEDDWDRTGGLEVIGAHVEEEEAHHRGLFRRRSQHDEHHDDIHDADVDDLHDEVLAGDAHEDDDTVGHPRVGDGDIPIAPYDPRPHRRRKRRKRVALLVSLVVLAALAGGIVFGGQRLWGLIVPKDYTGAGTGSVQIRISQGETLTAIGQTMVDKDVIASVRPFVKAAEADPNATGIAPGIYGLRRHMSGKAALQLLLKPSSRLVSRVTLPEGLTGKQILQRLAQGTGVPIDQLQAAAADTANLGLPAYANGSLEGFLFPATYDFEPGTTPQKMLQTMVARTVQTLDDLKIPAEQRLSVLTEASIVQAEAGSTEDMPKVARVLDNRLTTGMPLQLDTTVNYANGKAGLTTTPQDRLNPSPYNTYLHTGLPPGPISNPGEDALRAVLSPAQGDWLYFVVINPDTGETRFDVTAEAHQANVELFRQWLREHPGG